MFTHMQWHCARLTVCAHHSPCCCDGLWSWAASVPPGRWWRRPACAYTPGSVPRASPRHRCPSHPLSEWCHLGDIDWLIDWLYLTHAWRKKKKRKTKIEAAITFGAPSHAINRKKEAEEEETGNWHRTHLHARRSHSCIGPESPGWWRKGPLPRCRPPTWWRAPSCSAPPGWRPADLCVWRSRLRGGGEEGRRFVRSTERIRQRQNLDI